MGLPVGLAHRGRRNEHQFGRRYIATMRVGQGQQMRHSAAAGIGISTNSTRRDEDFAEDIADDLAVNNCTVIFH
jgi:hypothetical protein